MTEERPRLYRRSIMEPNDFVEKFYALVPGESLVYHKGVLSHDRRVDGEVEAIACMALRFGTPKGKIYKLYTELRKSTDSDFGAGIADLSQRTLADGVFEYVITKRKIVASTIDEEGKWQKRKDVS